MRSLLFLALGACFLPSVVAARQAADPAPQPQRTITRAEAIAMADRRFAAADTDGNGLLTQAERNVEREAMRARMPRGARPGGPDAVERRGPPLADGEAAPRRPMREDANPDGVVTRADYVDRAAKRFDRMDANHDGRLDPGEAPMRMERRGPPPPPAGAA